MSDRGRAAADDVRRALAHAMATERLRIVATLIGTTGDWDLAEDAVADAAERALRTWPRDGVPDNPAAWLTTTARRRAIDVIRRAHNERAKLVDLAALEALTGAGEARATPVVDDRLRLVFTCCHPALSLEARVALTLKVVAGLSTAAVARAFLVPEATMGQRLLRAKNKIANAGIPYRVPTPAMLPERLDGVLAVVYLAFTEGYAATDDATAEEAIRLGRLLVELVPDSDEARGLLALMLLQHSRRDARLVEGELVSLEQQDRRRWDRAAIDEALDLGRIPGAAPGKYRLQAALAAVHATASRADDTDWPSIVTLYDELLRVVPSPVVALNRAIALGMGNGPQAGLAALDALAGDPRMTGYHLVPAARGHLLAQLGRSAEAVDSLDRAIELAPTERERRQLVRRRDELGDTGD
ncbi:MAG: polymerase subunit sigma-24 [Nocardioides sp.]|nr:polymerase subunit sigma-24 [Nocardioides sp.]